METQTCSLCSKQLCFNENVGRFFEKDTGKVTEGAWCHGEKHDSLYFLCIKHFQYVNHKTLPLSYCHDCAKITEVEN